MRITHLAALAAVALCAGGCTLWPSSWRLGKTPLEKAEASQHSAAAANDQLLRKTQRDLHEAEEVFAGAPPSQPVTIGCELLADARASLDQAIGAPTAADSARWREFAARLISENLSTRVKAVDELAAQRRDTAAASSLAARATADAWKSKQQALAYAADREDLADFAGKLKLGFFGLIGLLLLGTVLSVVARFFPAFSLAAKVVNGTVATGITWAAQRAENGLRNVGTGMAKLRQEVGVGAEQLIERNFNSVVTAADHQQLIAAGAAAAGSPPPAS